MIGRSPSTTIQCILFISVLDFNWVTSTLSVNAFSLMPTNNGMAHNSRGWSRRIVPVAPTTILKATKSDKNKKRRRKNLASPSQDPIKVPQEEMKGLNEGTIIQEDDYEEDESLLQLQEYDLKQLAMEVKPTKSVVASPATSTTTKVLTTLSEIAKFDFRGDITQAMPVNVAKGIQDADVTTVSDIDDPSSSVSIPLPDITEVRKKKRREQELKRLEEENEVAKVKINRNDRQALLKLLERQPFADADDSYFEEQEYNEISALLGERAAPFLGIPFGPLQVGHFIGSLVIFMMAFIEYPGFPLTNLPTAFRESFQGGLATVYTINAALAISAVFQAKARRQPVTLWVMKTLGVGGLAYDQLTQLPTIEQIEKAKAIKGKRALKIKKG